MGNPRELWVQCFDCQHKWKICDFPLPMRAMTQQLRKAKVCPKCGSNNDHPICKTDEQPKAANG